MTATDRKIKDISLILKDLLKVIKVVSMYPADNPLPQSLRRSFSEKLEAIVDDYGDITIQVQAQCLIYDGQTVFQNNSKEDNLAGIFYEAGITEFAFKSGLDVLEIYKLLDVIKTYMNSPDKSQDLAAYIWEAGITGFALKTLEDIALSEYDSNFNIQEYIASDGASQDVQGVFHTGVSDGYQSIFTSEADSGKWEQADFRESGSQSLEDPDEGYVSLGDSPDDDVSSPGDPGWRAVVSGPRRATSAGGPAGQRVTEKGTNGLQYAELDDSTPDQPGAQILSEFLSDSPRDAKPIPDATLILNDEFKLSEEEEEVIRVIIEEDASFEPYQSTISLLQEMLLQETELPGFSETITICEKVMGEFIRLARLAEASSLLEHLKKLEGRVRKEKPMWADRLKEAHIAAGSRGRFEALAQALNDNADINPAELQRYLGNFGWEALSGVTELVGQLEHRQHRNTVLAFLSQRGKDNLDLIARGVHDRNLEVVRNAMSILAEVASDKALNYLAQLAKHTDADIRRQLVLLLRDCPNERAIPILQQIVGDSDPQIRRGAVNSIVSRRGPAAFEAITNVINDEKFPSLDEEDQRALLNAFSILGGDRALKYLCELITTYNHFHNRTLSFLRSAAFEALVVSRSEKTDLLLHRFSKSWRPDIKRQALAAIRQRAEMRSGDE
ncbi:MAG: HEAT repeat domain-containing protein [Candidatus Zixiibacteriota bacterium]|nr:MAG: HEAT repeat domain-containing protein [candidate division Zixibacteria bacterium]